MKQQNYTVITILGATAGGKTGVAAALANKIDAEIISADSRQIYRKMTIGTGKDIDDYTIDGVQIPFHLIDIVDPGYKYSVYEFQRDCFNAMKNISERQKKIILCGGTGMYIEAILKAYKLVQVPPNDDLRAELETKSIESLSRELNSLKTLHNVSDIDNKKRLIRAIEIAKYYEQYPLKQNQYPEVKSIIFGIKFDRDSRRKRITQRLEERLNSGMIQEVELLLDLGLKPEQLIYYGLEYKFLTLYITKQITYQEMFNSLNTAIHQFAKRQMTWFRKMEKNGFEINWIDGYENLEDKLNRMTTKIEQEKLF